MRTPSGVLLALLMLSLTACAATSLAPPETLLEDCRTPKASVSTNAELAESLKDAYSALYDCTDDKRALRTYYGLD